MSRISSITIQLVICLSIYGALQFALQYNIFCIVELVIGFAINALDEVKTIRPISYNHTNTESTQNKSTVILHENGKGSSVTVVVAWKKSQLELGLLVLF